MPRLTLDTDLWERVAAGLRQKQADNNQADFDRAVEVALRAAAVDTGAIEGLYAGQPWLYGYSGGGATGLGGGSRQKRRGIPTTLCFTTPGL